MPYLIRLTPSLVVLNVLFRVGIVLMFLYAAWKIPTGTASGIMGFIAGMAFLSLMSDEGIRGWFKSPEFPTIVGVPNHDGSSPDLDCYIGSESQFREHFADPVDQEHILMSALRHPNGNIWAVASPGRHHHVCWAMDILKVPQASMQDSGFLTSCGRYVDREEAAKIAYDYDQLLNKHIVPKELFSEDLWTNEPIPVQSK